MEYSYTTDIQQVNAWSLVNVLFISVIELETNIGIVSAIGNKQKKSIKMEADAREEGYRYWVTNVLLSSLFFINHQLDLVFVTKASKHMKKKRKEETTNKQQTTHQHVTELWTNRPFTAYNCCLAEQQQNIHAKYTQINPFPTQIKPLRLC